MQIDRLTDRGIQKMINGVPAILQISECVVKSKEGNDILLLDVSDGYVKQKKCAIMYEKDDKRSKVKLYDVIRVEQADVNMKNGNVAHIILSKFTLVRNDITVLIGQPINYLEFKQLKSNPKGDNMIPPRKVQGQKNKNKNSEFLQSIFDDNSKNKGKSPTKPNSLKKPPLKKAPQMSFNTNTNTNTIKPVQNGNKNQPSRNEINNQQNPKGNIVKPKQENNRHDRDYTLIKELYEGMDDWKLKVRIIFTSQLKTFVKKSNGQQSQLFSFEGCDLSDCIQFTSFGQTAVSFSSVINNDKVYVISGGRVIKDEKQNKLKITLSEKSTINLMEDDIRIPMVDDKCITPSQLLQKESGTEWNVIALIKDSQNIVQFVSKNGKDCRKKQIYLCDPQAQVQVPLTLWFQRANSTFQKLPYALQGIQVSSYNSQKQFTTSLRFNYRQFKQHQFRKYINSLEMIKFQNPIRQTSANKTPNLEITNFQILRQQAQNLQGNNSITMEKVCYVSSISTNSKSYYLSCPYCKKKVFDVQNAQCIGQKCGKRYDKAKYRYLLNLALTDEVEMLWATAYDEAAEIILSSPQGQKYTADQCAAEGEQKFKDKIKDALDREVKVTILAKKDYYGGQSRIKYGISKAAIKIDYASECQILEKKLAFLLREVQGK